ncbi:MAG: TonB C-terminal domain-containing protein [bacterium]|nr:TonB C-terminal domain-containing protein [bacterium]
MFRCSECGQEFEIKPDYCDCGNDIFEEVSNVEKVEEPVKIEEKNVVKSEKAEKTEIFTKSKKDIDTPVDIPSLVIFVMCILLSLFVIFFPWTNEKTDVVAEKEKSSNLENNVVIPSIDKIWDSTVNKEVQVVKQETPVQVQAQQVVEQPLVEKTIPAQKKNEVAKTQIAPVKTQPKVQVQPKPQQKAQVKNQPKPVVSSTSQQTVKPSQVNVAPKANPKELANYKFALNKKIASKINFANVLGDGTCTVVFKISSTGELINRKFSVQSSNGMLNDEVYRAILSVPIYKAPPASYKGEYLKFVVKFYSDNYEISLN